MSESQLKRKTARGLMWGGIGNGLMQVLNLLFGVFLARLLSPSDYGVVGALTIFSAVAGMLSESGFILALVNKREVDGRDFNAVFWFNVVMSITIYSILFVCAPFIADFYNMEEMTWLARFLFLSFVVGAFSAVPTAYLFRNLMVKQRSRIQITAMIVSGIVGVTCAWYGLGYWGIAVQTVLYSGCNSVLLWIACPWRPGFSFDRERLRSMLPFSLRQLATSLFTHINNNIFAVLLGRFYGMRVTGFYTQGNKWTTMGYSTMTGMINSVGQPVFRQTIDEPDRLLRVFRKMMRFAAFVSFPAMFGLAIVARPLITLAITDKWLDCVPVMQVLCVGGAFLPFVTLYSNLFNSLNRPAIYMWSTISLGVAQLLCLIFSYPYGLMTMLAIYTSLNILWLLVWHHFASRYIGIRWIDTLRDIGPYLLLAIGIMTVTELVTGEIVSPLPALVSRIAIAAGLYVGALWVSGSAMLRETMDFVMKKRDGKDTDN